MGLEGIVPTAAAETRRGPGRSEAFGEFQAASSAQERLAAVQGAQPHRDSMCQMPLGAGTAFVLSADHAGRQRRHRRRANRVLRTPFPTGRRRPTVTLRENPRHDRNGDRPSCHSATRRCHNIMTKSCHVMTRLAEVVSADWQLTENRAQVGGVWRGGGGVHGQRTVGSMARAEVPGIEEAQSTIRLQMCGRWPAPCPDREGFRMVDRWGFGRRSGVGRCLVFAGW